MVPAGPETMGVAVTAAPVPHVVSIPMSSAGISVRTAPPSIRLVTHNVQTGSDNQLIRLAPAAAPGVSMISSSGVMTNCQIVTEDVISLPPLGTPKMSLITLEPERDNNFGHKSIAMEPTARYAPNRLVSTPKNRAAGAP